METVRFEDSGIDERILRAVKEMGFESMSPIQQAAIPKVLEGRDVIGQAQTGTGKTAAFGIPILQMISPEEKGVQSIILCPTRELAIQAAEEIRKYAKFMHGIKVLPIYGGQDMNRQIRSLASNVQIVVGTPGRVMDHMRRHTLKLQNTKIVVLDEADEMLNMGFREDIETILKDIPSEHQTVLFSATMPKAILDITSTYQKPDAEYIQIEKKELTIPLVKQYYYEVKKANKEEAIARILDYYNPRQTLIFCNTKRMVDELQEKLMGRGYFAEGLHGDMSQAARDKVMNSFRNGTTEILIATDVAARGIDVDDVEAVINYDIPQDIEYYVHRIGRTGRAGRSGRSFTLVVGREIYKIKEIEKTCHTKIKARTIPTSRDITAAKSEKILNDVIAYMKENDISRMISVVEKRLDEEDCTAIELAAALLKQQMGEELPDIPTENYFEERKKMRMEGRNHKKYGKSGHSDRDNKKYRGRKDSGGKKEKHGSRDDWEKRDRKDKHGSRDDWEKKGKKNKRERKEKIDVRMDGSRKIKTISHKH